LLLARRQALEDVRSKGQLLEGLHLLLELVGIRRVQLGLRQTLLLLTNRQHRVQILQTHLLLRLAKARELLPEARDPLTKTRRLLLRTKPSLNARQSKLRGLKPEVPGQLCARHAKLAGRLRRLLGPLRRLLKSACAELRRAARLLLKDVALKLLLSHRLTRPAKCALANSPCAKALPSNLALPRDVGHRLLDHGLLERVHVRHGCARSQACDARACGAEPKTCGLLRALLTRSDLPRDLLAKAHGAKTRFFQSSNASLCQAGSCAQERLECPNALTRHLESLQLVRGKPRNLLGRHVQALGHKAVGKL
jgi:hypothetical protein